MPHTIQMSLMVSLGISSGSFIVIIAPHVLCSVHISKLPVAAAAVWIFIYYYYHYHLPSFTLYLKKVQLDATVGSLIYFTAKSLYISRKLKLILKNTIIDKTLTYALETSTLTKRDRKQLNILRGKCIEEF